MAVKFLHKTEVQEKILAKTIQTKVDSYVSLMKASKLTPEQEAASKEAAKLAAELKELAAADPTEEKLVFDGSTHRVVFSAPRTTREVNNVQAVYDELGHEVFMKLAQIRLSDLDLYMTPIQQEKAVLVKKDGARTMKVEEI